MAITVSQSNLTKDERRLIHKLLGDSYKKLATGIAEALLSSAGKLEDWNSIVRPGVVCLVEDLDKKQFAVIVIDVDKKIIVWKQHIDNHLKCERRRRWIFVLQSGYRKLCLNFIDDDEADNFNVVFYNLFPQLRCFEAKIPYYVSKKGKVVTNEPIHKTTKLTRSRNSHQEVKLSQCNLSQHSSHSGGSSASSKTPLSESRKSSLYDLPLPDKLYSAPPSEYSSSETESDVERYEIESQQSSLEDIPQLRITTEEHRRKCFETRITSAPPLPPRIAILKESPKIPRKSSTLTRKQQYLYNDYLNDLHGSELEKYDSESETDSEEEATNLGLTKPALSVGRNVILQPPILNNYLIQTDDKSYTANFIGEESIKKLTKPNKKFVKKKNLKSGNSYGTYVSKEGLESSSNYVYNAIAEVDCFASSKGTHGSISKIKENARAENKFLTLPRLPSPEMTFQDAPLKVPKTSNSNQHKYVSLPSPPPFNSLPSQTASSSCRESFEFLEEKSNNSAESRNSFLDQIKNHGIRLRKVERSRTIDVKNKDASQTEGEGNISTLLVGAMKNIRGFKGHSGIYDLEEDTYRCWDD